MCLLDDLHQRALKFECKTPKENGFMDDILYIHLLAVSGINLL